MNGSGLAASRLLKNTLGSLSLWERAGVRVSRIGALHDPLTLALSPCQGERGLLLRPPRGFSKIGGGRAERDAGPSSTAFPVLRADIDGRGVADA